MKFLTRLSIGLIAITLTLPLWFAHDLILFVQPERALIARGELHSMYSYENFVHEAGFGRLAISVIALLILFIPYRKGEPWAFGALMVWAVAYYVPVFLYGAVPTLGTWPLFRNLNLQHSRASNLAWEEWSSFILTAFLVLGLAMSAPAFFRKRA